MMEEKENISDELDLCVASEATKLKTSKKLPKKKRCVQKRGKNICTFISVPPFLPTALLCLHFFDGSRKRQTNISFPFLFLLSTHTGLEWGGEGGKEEKEKASVILFLPHLSNGRSRPKKWKVAIYFSKKNLWLCKFSLYSFPFSWNFQENFICTVDSHANPKKLLPLRSANILISNRHLFLLLLLPSVFPSKSPQAKQKGEERERGQKRATLGTRFSLPARRKNFFCGERKRWVLSRGDYRRRRRKSDAFFVASTFPSPLEKRPIAAAKDSEKGGKEEDGFFKARLLHFRLFKRKNFPNGKTKFLTFPSFFGSDHSSSLWCKTRRPIPRKLPMRKKKRWAMADNNRPLWHPIRRERHLGSGVFWVGVIIASPIRDHPPKWISQWAMAVFLIYSPIQSNCLMFVSAALIGREEGLGPSLALSSSLLLMHQAVYTNYLRNIFPQGKVGW